MVTSEWGTLDTFENGVVSEIVIGRKYGRRLYFWEFTKRKKLQEMLGALKAGDKVMTSGGIYGVINGFDGDTVILKIADTGSSPVKIRIARSAITQVETTEDAK
jgi:preprotein translocase YajC subunit